ncbi:MAG: hypothetical protein ACQESP_11015 [Candidatus Muiribacteriota bacterium]
MDFKRIHGWLKKHPGIYWWFRLKIQKHPGIYFFILNKSSINKKFLVKRNSNITIEGFPRSANTFSRCAFLIGEAQKKGITDYNLPNDIWNKYNYKIGTHLHSSAQVIRSVKLKIPTLVLIRNPKDAIVSMKAREIQTSNNPELAKCSIREYIKFYIDFYKNIMPYKNEIVIGKFEEVTKDFGKVIENVNDKFGTDFGRFRHTKKNLEIAKSKTKHILPDSERDKIKSEVKNELENHKKLLKKAQEVYEEFTS